MQNHTNNHVIEHSFATETLIVFSQSLLFIFLFVILKIGLIDRRGMMADIESATENIFQIIAIFFAILVFIMIVMLPMHTYEYYHYVAFLSFLVIFTVIVYDCRFAYNNTNTNTKSKRRPSTTSQSIKPDNKKLVAVISRSSTSEDTFDF